MSSSNPPTTPRRRIQTGAGSASPITDIAQRLERYSIKEEAPSPLRHVKREPEPSDDDDDDDEESDSSAQDASDEEPDDQDKEVEDSETDSEDEMTTLEFRGKADTLDNLLTHCQVQFLARPSRFGTDQSKSGFVAKHFQGPALDWLTQEWKKTPKLLDSYDEFVITLRSAFDASEETQKQIADQKLRRLKQTGSASNYALQFDPLVALLQYNDEAKKAAFLAGLKPDVKKSLAGESFASYTDLRTKTLNVDESLYALRGQRPRRSGRPKKPGSN